MTLIKIVLWRFERIDLKFQIVSPFCAAIASEYILKNFLNRNVLYSSWIVWADVPCKSKLSVLPHTDIPDIALSHSLPETSRCLPSWETAYIATFIHRRHKQFSTKTTQCENTTLKDIFIRHQETLNQNQTQNNFRITLLVFR